MAGLGGGGGGILGEFKGESQHAGKRGPCLKAFTDEQGSIATVMMCYNMGQDRAFRNHLTKYLDSSIMDSVPEVLFLYLL